MIAFMNLKVRINQKNDFCVLLSHRFKTDTLNEKENIRFL